MEAASRFKSYPKYVIRPVEVTWHQSLRTLALVAGPDPSTSLEHITMNVVQLLTTFLLAKRDDNAADDIYIYDYICR